MVFPTGARLAALAATALLPLALAIRDTFDADTALSDSADQASGRLFGQRSRQQLVSLDDALLRKGPEDKGRKGGAPYERLDDRGSGETIPRDSHGGDESPRNLGKYHQLHDSDVDETEMQDVELPPRRMPLGWDTGVEQGSRWYRSLATGVKQWKHPVVPLVHEQKILVFSRSDDKWHRAKVYALPGEMAPHGPHGTLQKVKEFEAYISYTGSKEGRGKFVDATTDYVRIEEPNAEKKVTSPHTAAQEHQESPPRLPPKAVKLETAQQIWVKDDVLGWIPALVEALPGGVARMDGSNFQVGKHKVSVMFTTGAPIGLVGSRKIVDANTDFVRTAPPRPPMPSDSGGATATAEGADAPRPKPPVSLQEPPREPEKEVNKENVKRVKTMKKVETQTLGSGGRSQATWYVDNPEVRRGQKVSVKSRSKGEWYAAEVKALAGDHIAVDYGDSKKDEFEVEADTIVVAYTEGPYANVWKPVWAQTDWVSTEAKNLAQMIDGRKEKKKEKTHVFITFNRGGPWRYDQKIPVTPEEKMTLEAHISHLDADPDSYGTSVTSAVALLNRGWKKDTFPPDRYAFCLVHSKGKQGGWFVLYREDSKNEAIRKLKSQSVVTLLPATTGGKVKCNALEKDRHCEIHQHSLAPSSDPNADVAISIRGESKDDCPTICEDYEVPPAEDLQDGQTSRSQSVACCDWQEEAKLCVGYRVSSKARLYPLDDTPEPGHGRWASTCSDADQLPLASLATKPKSTAQPIGQAFKPKGRVRAKDDIVVELGADGEFTVKAGTLGTIQKVEKKKVGVRWDTTFRTRYRQEIDEMMWHDERNLVHEASFLERESQVVSPEGESASRRGHAAATLQAALDHRARQQFYPKDQ